MVARGHHLVQLCGCLLVAFLIQPMLTVLTLVACGLVSVVYRSWTADEEHCCQWCRRCTAARGYRDLSQGTAAGISSRRAGSQRPIR
jgi:hypothetical protein